MSAGASQALPAVSEQEGEEWRRLTPLAIEVVIVLSGLRSDHGGYIEDDDRFIRPGEVHEYVAQAKAYEDVTPHKVAAILRALAEEGLIERNRHVKHTAYRENPEAMHAVDRGGMYRVED